MNSSAKLPFFPGLPSRFRLYSLLILLHFFPGLLLPLVSASQDSLFFQLYSWIDLPAAELNKIRASGATKITDKFLLAWGRQLDRTNDSLRSRVTAGWKSCCIPADLNGDRLPDMIFSGSCDGKLPVTRIFLNRKDSFELVFEDYQYITSLSIKKGVLGHLLMADSGTGGDLVVVTREYQVVQERDALIFRKGKQAAWFRYTEKPATWSEQIKPFRSAFDTILIRASAEDIDDPFIVSWNTWGNIVAGYTRRIRGNILAEQVDSLNYRWYFIEVIPDLKPRKSLFPSSDSWPTFIRGWVREEEVVL